MSKERGGRKNWNIGKKRLIYNMKTLNRDRIFSREALGKVVVEHDNTNLYLEMYNSGKKNKLTNVSRFLRIYTN